MVVNLKMGADLDAPGGATEFELTFDPKMKSVWRLDRATWAQSCRPGRGHEEFAPEPCV